MKKIFIIRHAKSSWDFVGLYDIDRPLNERGIKDAYKMAEWLKSKCDLDCIISSNGIRALHTATVFAKKQGISHQLLIHENLYHPSPSDFIDSLQQLDERVHSVALFAHNPGIEELLHLCTNSWHIVPTCGVLSFACNSASWKTLDYKDLEFLDLNTPKTI